jgi:hypothetical protein
MQKSFLWALGAAVFVLSDSKALARDLGQWDDVDPLVRKWFRELKQPDNPSLSCCGETDAYWADDYEVNGDQYVAIITDTRDDKKWGSGNPTGTALSSSALVVTFFVTCRPGEDRFSSAHGAAHSHSTGASRYCLSRCSVRLTH